MFYTLIQVALGGAIGASGRYLTGVATVRIFGHGFPWGTLTVNVIGSFIMGVIVVLLGEFSANRLAPFLMTGVLGGFTTFSAFSLDAMTLYERGDVGLALGYIAVSVMVSLAAIAVGVLATRAMFA
ncbi:fluoride efflux transporter CrcB [Pseudoruegeria sp. HB172150]|uniref:fluoride efflux transporter CrcB n=1 Tax=Pseudoruegeria sp. HB172150 TaxID=2721164 RepID=UPI0015571533|nr:fluoride efflux transporter CrcB [Pseudoruegeria sp. HB172150]